MKKQNILILYMVFLMIASCLILIGNFDLTFGIMTYNSIFLSYYATSYKSFHIYTENNLPVHDGVEFLMSFLTHFLYTFIFWICVTIFLWAVVNLFYSVTAHELLNIPFFEVAVVLVTNIVYFSFFTKTGRLFSKPPKEPLLQKEEK
ncbi:hypothetical protein MsAm2_16350 [Methanolapillus ohkumae]|uniref:Uncharacterized protein n=1 Tax=Methanolapillus ohkumae TaxID=3028298 RepID=A0AA96V8I9_9EURY|nr:hypothetical protein MsAm2_16350 [Methanosarcinaceae archaeon Am2]